MLEAETQANTALAASVHVCFQQMALCPHQRTCVHPQHQWWTGQSSLQEKNITEQKIAYIRLTWLTDWLADWLLPPGQAAVVLTDPTPSSTAGTGRRSHFCWADETPAAHKNSLLNGFTSNPTDCVYFTCDCVHLLPFGNGTSLYWSGLWAVWHKVQTCRILNIWRENLLLITLLSRTHW